MVNNYQQSGPRLSVCLYYRVPLTLSLHVNAGISVLSEAGRPSLNGLWDEATASV